MRCIHVLNSSAEEVVESTIEFFSWRHSKVEPCNSFSPNWSSSILGIFALSPQWMTIRENLRSPNDLAAHLAHLLKTFSIVITLDEPNAWGFTAFHENERIGSYNWQLPSGFLEQRQKRIHDFEEDRLRQLGVKGLETIKIRRTQRRENPDISDPYLEQHYRLKISNGKMGLDPPDLQPDLARSLHKVTGMSTAAKIKRILGTAHVNISGAVTEFNQALGLPNWIDECASDNIEFLIKRRIGFLYRLIEK